MQQQHTGDVFRLDTPSRRDLRALGIVGGVLLLAGVLALAPVDRVSSDGGTAATAAPAPTTCGPLWDRLRVSGDADATVAMAAAEAGLVTRGSWISRDGLTWEHVDGRVVVVAHPRTSGTALPVGCDGVTSHEASVA